MPDTGISLEGSWCGIVCGSPQVKFMLSVKPHFCMKSFANLRPVCNLLRHASHYRFHQREMSLHYRLLQPCVCKQMPYSCLPCCNWWKPGVDVKQGKELATLPRKDVAQDGTFFASLCSFGLFKST